MKRLTVSVTFVLLLLVCSLAVVPNAVAFVSTGDGGWYWQNPLPQGCRLLDVDFVDATRGWAVGENGVILATSDGGATWAKQVSGTCFALLAVAFADPQHGWTATHRPGNFEYWNSDGAIYATTDGGATWTQQGVGYHAEDFACIDALHVWAAAGDRILATNDGGATWSERWKGAFLHAIAFADATHGWAVGEGGVIVATSDGGLTWTAQTSGTTERLKDVAFVDASHGWAVGDSGTILATSDGGATWAVQTSGGRDLRAVAFTDASHGWAVAGQGNYVRTSDGGVTWTWRYFPHARDLEGVSFGDATHGCMVGKTGVIDVTVDGGATWSRKSSGIFDTLVDVSFADASHGLAVGADGRIVTTADGGVTWTVRESGATSYLTGACCVDASRAWAVGFDGTIVHTTDGGATWTPQVSGVTNLEAVTFVNASRGWAVGGGGLILATTDGGAHWKRQTPGTGDYYLEDVCFIDASHGWAVGGHHIILATKNGGATWVQQSRSSYPWNAYDSVCFINASRGWVSSSDNTGAFLAATKDGGATWKPDWWVPASGVFEPESITFTDASRGWMVGDNEVMGRGGDANVWATRDGGANWKSQNSGFMGITHRLHAVCFIDARHGWAVGDDGTILATRTGGLAPVRTAVSGAVNGRWYRAPVTLTLNVTDDTGGVGVAYTEYKLDDTPWMKGRSLTVRGEGPHVVLYRSADKAANLEGTHTLKVGIDTAKPSTKAPSTASVVYGRTALLMYRVVDPLPNGGTATATIKIKNRAGTVVKRLGPYKGVAVNELLGACFTCTLPRGTYPFSVYATDRAGNVQKLPVGSNRLVVR